MTIFRSRVHNKKKNEYGNKKAFFGNRWPRLSNRVLKHVDVQISIDRSSRTSVVSCFGG